MTVRELIERLQGLPDDTQELRVFMPGDDFCGQLEVRDAVEEDWPKDISMNRDGRQVSLY